MGMTLGFLGRGKTRRLIFLSIFHILGAIIGGGLTGGLLGLFGTLSMISSVVAYKPMFIALVAIFALWQSISRCPARLGLYWLQVPRSWYHTMNAELCYFFWGLLLGCGVATVIPYSVFLVIMVSQLVSGVMLGCISGALFGGTRQLVTLLPLLVKENRLHPENIGMLMPRLAKIASRLNIVWVIVGSFLLLATSWH